MIQVERMVRNLCDWESLKVNIILGHRQRQRGFCSVKIIIESS